ncbi:hypothetical protein LTR56_027332, partial [Elasticomyces elasticus]
NITNTIIAIPTNSPHSSVYGGTLPCDARFRYIQEWTATTPCTVKVLNEHVPYSIFSSQPWCTTYLREQGRAGTCPMTRGYKPILVVPEEVLQEMEPAWSTYYDDIRGVYDPPFEPAASAAGPSISDAVTVATASQTQTQPAMPGPRLGASTSTATVGPITTAAPIAQADTEGNTRQAIPSPSDCDQGSAIDAAPTSTSNPEETVPADPDTESSATPPVSTLSGYDLGLAVDAEATTTLTPEGANVGGPSELSANNP